MCPRFTIVTKCNPPPLPINERHSCIMEDEVAILCQTLDVAITQRASKWHLQLPPSSIFDLVWIATIDFLLPNIQSFHGSFTTNSIIGTMGISTMEHGYQIQSYPMVTWNLACIILNAMTCMHGTKKRTLHIYKVNTHYKI